MSLAYKEIYSRDGRTQETIAINEPSSGYQIRVFLTGRREGYGGTVIQEIQRRTARNGQIGWETVQRLGPDEVSAGSSLPIGSGRTSVVGM